MRWLIAVPVWGKRAIRMFLQNGLPSLRAALKHYPVDAAFLIRTDEPELFRREITDYPMLIRECTSGERYSGQAECHLDGINKARDGERVVLYCADQIVSIETFQYCESRFAEGFEAIAACALRSLDSVPAPIGATGRELFAWGFDNIHPICAEFIYGGKAYHVGNMLFRRGDNVVFRGFTMGPFAAIKRPGLTFQHSADTDFLCCYPQERVHVLHDYGMGIASTTEDDRAFPLLDHPFEPADALKYLRRSKNIGDWHWKALTYRLPFKGEAVDCGDEAFVREMFRLAGKEYPGLSV